MSSDDQAQAYELLRPPAYGTYQVIVEASTGRDSYAASIPLLIVAGAVEEGEGRS